MGDDSNLPDRSGLGYGHLKDGEAVKLAQSGDTRALITMICRYEEFVRLKARSYFLIGADRDDIIQEGMIGLYKAIRDYREDKDTSFKGFAELCITRQIITAVKMATRQKHTPLNSYVSLNNPVPEAEDSDRRVFEFLASRESLDPAEMVISDDEALSIKVNFGRMLSGLEAQVLKLYIEGRSYQEIAVLLDRHVKSIDNALQRIKKKIEQHLYYRECLASGLIKNTGSTRKMAGRPA